MKVSKNQALFDRLIAFKRNYRPRTVHVAAPSLDPTITELPSGMRLIRNEMKLYEVTVVREGPGRIERIYSLKEDDQ